ncbi:MAG TPA: hypothetical protein VMU61_01135 [Candidatus Aquilonibacter sp.]|nr:hypothetical protein [Candidatus Aquilonibacter sp.]
MLRRLGLGISYFVAVVYILSFAVPFSFLLSCLPKCGGSELDAFLPAAALTPFGAVATAFSWRNAIQNISKGESLWLFWPLAIVFSIVLLGVVAMIAIVVIYDIHGNLMLHRSLHP